MYTFPPGMWTALLISRWLLKNYLSQKRITQNKKKSDRAMFVLAYAFYINVYFCPLHTYEWNYWRIVHVLTSVVILAYAPTNDSIFCILFTIYAIHFFYFHHYSECIMLPYLILISTFLITNELNSFYMFIWSLWYN